MNFFPTNLIHLITLVIFIYLTPTLGSEVNQSNVDLKNETKSPNVWLYSFLAIMLVSASGFIGILLVPFMNKSFYNVSTQYLIALSVGSLIGDAFLHLIPHALVEHEHSHDESSSHADVINKGLVILLGFYIFFLTERITILYQNNSTRKKMKQRWVKKTKCKSEKFNSLTLDQKSQHETLLVHSKDENNAASLMYDPRKSLSDESICSINSHHDHDQNDDCLERKSGLSSDHSHLICTSDEVNHTEPCEIADYVNEIKKSTANPTAAKQQICHVHNPKMSEDEIKASPSKGMRSHVGGVDTAPPTFSMPLRCHHVNMRHCRSPNRRHRHHHLHRRIFHNNSRSKKISMKVKQNSTETCLAASENRRALSDINIDSRFFATQSAILNQTKPSTANTNHGHSHEEASSNRLSSFLSKLRPTGKDSRLDQYQPIVHDKITNTELKLLKKRILSSQSDSNIHQKTDDDEVSIRSEVFYTPSLSKEAIENKISPLKVLLNSESYQSLAQTDDSKVNGQHNKNSSNGHTHHHSHCLPSGYTFVSPLRDKPHGHHHGHSHDLSSVRSIAYTIIAGDGLHNFCDGIAIGAAFSANTKIGLSTFLAVICHELPHELGDFAVLLNAGMPVKTVIFYNCLTGIFCFTGMIIGVFLSNSSKLITNWMFLATAGIFIYIALVDMVPELATQRLKGSYNYHRPTVLFIVQNFGLFTGVGVMTAIAFIESTFS